MVSAAGLGDHATEKSFSDTGRGTHVPGDDPVGPFRRATVPPTATGESTHGVRVWFCALKTSRDETETHAKIGHGSWLTTCRLCGKWASQYKWADGDARFLGVRCTVRAIMLRTYGTMYRMVRS